VPDKLCVKLHMR